MKVLILGGGGMLGHRLFLHLRLNHDVRVTLRDDVATYKRLHLFDGSNAYGGVNVLAMDRLLEVVGDFQPEAIVNCIGVVKQLAVAKESIPSIAINALLPHRLALLAKTAGARLVHFSTDCVYSGKKGNYAEGDTPDPEDLYGRTKLLGELHDEHTLTIRTSLIGHELGRNTALLEWFLAQKGRVRGYRKAVFSAFTTMEMARIVEMLLVENRCAHGVWHVSSDPIDKCTLLGIVRQHYRVDTEIVPDDELVCDRSLNSTLFRQRFQYTPPSWDSMIAEMNKTQRFFL